MPASQRSCQGQNADGGCSGAFQHAGALRYGRSRRQYVVDNYNALAGDAATSPHRKGSAHIAIARRRPKMALHRRSSAADQPIRCDLGSPGGAHRLGEQCGLVVASLKEPGPVQRHRDEKIGAGEHLAAVAVHPAPERRRYVGTVAMLQPEHETAAVLVVPQHGTRLIPGRALARTAAAQRIFTHRMRKGQPAQHAPGRGKEGDPAPAPAA